ncbi:MAG: carboxypeptidase regulatory-like domain-containing protein [Prevotella sp.]|nr:carboxypeptidase regulatory-like domain-containing protein [Prevotella sp.]
MKTCLNILFLLLLPATMMQAQRVSRDYRDRPMTEVLSDLASAGGQRIVFIHDELHDFTVTQQFDSLTVAEAIRACIGFYPISLHNQGDTILLVKCTQPARYRLIGRLTDERGVPVSYANITLRSTTDSTIINKGVSNQNGRFVIPTDEPEALLRISHVGYQDVSRTCEVADIGTITMPVCDVHLKQVDIKTQPSPNRSERKYRKYAHKIEDMVWSMNLPAFRIDTIPEKYKDSPAVIIAEYDSIEYRRVRHVLPVLPLFGGYPDPLGLSVQMHERHLHRTRIFINSDDAARKYSYWPYTTADASVRFLLDTYWAFTGIKVIKQNGREQIIDTYAFFSPDLNLPEKQMSYIPIDSLETGDIIDSFTYFQTKNSVGRNRFYLQQELPIMNYDCRLKCNKRLCLSYRQVNNAPDFTKRRTKGDHYLLSYSATDISGNAQENRPYIATLTDVSRASIWTPTTNKAPVQRIKGITPNPPVREILKSKDAQDCFWQLQQAREHGLRFLKADSLSTKEAIERIACSELSDIEKTAQLYSYLCSLDLLYTHFAFHEKRQKHYPYLTDVLVFALSQASIPFDLAMTTKEGSEPIDLLLSADDIIFFIRLKDGKCFFPGYKVQPGCIPDKLRGRKAVLDDWQTFFFL